MTNLNKILGGVIGTIFHLVALLPQQKTNGKSNWGTPSAPKWPPFLTNNPLPNGFPWSNLDCHSDPSRYKPTGVIRHYDFTVQRGVISPDGYQKNVLLVNGQFPGPAIEANWGDTIQVTVHNQITGPEEGTAMHWHGFLQTATPWFDGVPAVQQCPIAPGASFTYQFVAELYGSTWYHSHYSAQYSGGIVGPMIIHGPSTNAKYDIDMGPVILSDYYHQDYFSIVQEVVGGGSISNPRPASDNNLINGKMNFDCSTVAAGDKTPCVNNAGISTFTFTTGKTHKLRLVNTGSEGIQRFSIDQHNLTVITNDFTPIVPYTTKVVTLGVGQRADVLVTANQGPATSAFWMRSNVSVLCTEANQPNALAAIYYDKANTSQSPASKPWNVADPGTCANDDLSLTVPYAAIKPASKPSTTRNLDINFEVNATGSFLWTLDSTTFKADFNDPVLLLADQGNYSYPAEWNVKNFGTNATIRIVVNNPGPASHPMHLHGNTMSILHEGPGNWDGTSITNPSNPIRRDVQLVRAGGHLVFQFVADNPGVWPFHCHIAWHTSAGLYANLVIDPPKIAQRQIPSIMQQTCTNWAAYTKKNIVEEIDSGV